MKINIILLLILSLTKSSCTKTQANNEIILEGKIGTFLSSINLNENGDKYNGYFSYKGKKQKINISGTRIDNNLILHEFNNDEENSLTGIFNGTFDGDFYKGFWTGPKKGKKVSFNFRTNKNEKVNVPQIKSIKNNVEYIWSVVDEFDPYALNLTAKVNNKIYKILDNVQQFEVGKMDFNDNGYTDLITIENCGTGTGCPYNVLYYIHFDQVKNKFIVSKEFGYTDDAKIEIWKGKKSIVMTTYKSAEMYKARERYTFENDKPKRVEINETLKIKALKELYQDGTLEYKDNYKLFFDINNDGEVDEVSCGYWLKWGVFTNCTVNFGGEKISIDGSGKRVGILSTKTNGYNDLVFDLNDVYVWDGKKYTKK